MAAYGSLWEFISVFDESKTAKNSENEMRANGHPWALVRASERF